MDQATNKSEMNNLKMKGIRKKMKKILKIAFVCGISHIKRSCKIPIWIKSNLLKQQ